MYYVHTHAHETQNHQSIAFHCNQKTAKDIQYAQDKSNESIPSQRTESGSVREVMKT